MKKKKNVKGKKQEKKDEKILKACTMVDKATLS